MTDFCKIFESKTYGQILVKLDIDDESYREVSFSFNPEKIGHGGLGICECAVKFKGQDEDQQHENSRKYFDEVNLEFAEAYVKQIADMTFAILD